MCSDQRARQYLFSTGIAAFLEEAPSGSERHASIFSRINGGYQSLQRRRVRNGLLSLPH